MARKQAWKMLSAMLVGGLLSVPSLAKAAAFPPQLLGRSVVVKWIRQLTMKRGDSNVDSFNSTGQTFSIYVSTAGRAFSKLMTIISFEPGIAGRDRISGTVGRCCVAESNQAPGDNRTSKGATRVVHFDGNTLLVDSPFFSGASRVAITFDAGYGNCSARVTYGREGGTGPIRGNAAFGGQPIEIVSVQGSNLSCSITSGNVFGGQ